MNLFVWFLLQYGLARSIRNVMGATIAITAKWERKKNWINRQKTDDGKSLTMRARALQKKWQNNERKLIITIAVAWSMMLTFDCWDCCSRCRRRRRCCYCFQFITMPLICMRNKCRLIYFLFVCSRCMF